MRHTAVLTSRRPTRPLWSAQPSRPVVGILERCRLCLVHARGVFPGAPRPRRRLVRVSQLPNVYLSFQRFDLVHCAAVKAEIFCLVVVSTPRIGGIVRPGGAQRGAYAGVRMRTRRQQVCAANTSLCSCFSDCFTHRTTHELTELCSSTCCCCSHINSHNQVRGHRTGSSHSGAGEYPREKNTNQRWDTHI